MYHAYAYHTVDRTQVLLDVFWGLMELMGLMRLDMADFYIHTLTSLATRRGEPVGMAHSALRPGCGPHNTKLLAAGRADALQVQ
eukprot:349651-Chlamydomonas_euryale.AAC.6